MCLGRARGVTLLSWLPVLTETVEPRQRGAPPGAALALAAFCLIPSLATADERATFVGVALGDAAEARVALARLRWLAREQTAPVTVDVRQGSGSRTGTAIVAPLLGYGLDLGT